jgi:hypothetical protein
MSTAADGGKVVMLLFRHTHRLLEGTTTAISQSVPPRLPAGEGSSHSIGPANVTSASDAIRL